MLIAMSQDNKPRWFTAGCAVDAYNQLGYPDGLSNGSMSVRSLEKLERDTAKKIIAQVDYCLMAKMETISLKVIAERVGCSERAVERILTKLNMELEEE